MAELVVVAVEEGLAPELVVVLAKVVGIPADDAVELKGVLEIANAEARIVVDVSVETEELVVTFVLVDVTPTDVVLLDNVVLADCITNAPIKAVCVVDFVDVISVEVEEVSVDVVDSDGEDSNAEVEDLFADVVELEDTDDEVDEPIVNVDTVTMLKFVEKAEVVGLGSTVEVVDSVVEVGVPAIEVVESAADKDVKEDAVFDALNPVVDVEAVVEGVDRVLSCCSCGLRS